MNSEEVKPNRQHSFFVQSTFALGFSAGRLIAGGLLEHYLGVALFKSWAIAIYPVVLTTRGALNGILAARLSTGLNIGLIKPSFRGSTGCYHAIVSSLMALSMIVSLILSVIALLLTGAPISEFPLILAICISIQALTLLLTEPLTSAAGFLAFKKGLDPDAMLYPTSSTIADIWATSSYIIVLSLVFFFPGGVLLTYIIAIATIIVTVIFAFISRREAEYWRTLEESSLTIILVTFISTLSGYALFGIRSKIGEFPGVLLVYPALIGTLGDIVAIFGSLSTTRIFLGAVERKLSRVLAQVRDIIQLWLSAMIYFTMYGLIAYFFSREISRLLISLISFNMVFPVVITLASIVAILTFKRGWNPDNFVIPIETTLTDVIMTVSIALLITIL
ncbi:MAG: magnesium transporter [Candidatus Korarchaeota archaeon]|nr:magnesium transporter [Thermoproteota archaeon]